MDKDFLVAEARSFVACEPAAELVLVDGYPVVTIGAPLPDDALAAHVAQMLDGLVGAAAAQGRLAA